MATAKETPRQKMISMMYLVLTALLAMNAPKELIDSFVVVNEGLEESNKGLEEKNDLTMNFFKSTAESDSIFVNSYEKGKTIRTTASQLYDHIEELKRYLIARTEKFDNTEDLMNLPDSLFFLRKVKVKDNYDVPTYELIGSDNNNPRPASEKYSALYLKELIVNFKQEVLKNFNQKDDPAIHGTVNKYFSLAAKEGQDNALPWEIRNFYHLPLAAVVTNLSRMQLDVLNTQTDAMSQLMRNVNKNRFVVDSLEARVIPRSNYVMMGDSFMADIFVSASSSTIEPEVFITDQVDENGNFKEENCKKLASKVSKNGVVSYAFKPSHEGDYKWAGFVRVKKPGQVGYDTYPIRNQKYTVAKKNLTISPTAMNIFYRDLENPIKVAAPGVASPKIKVSCTNAQVVAVNKNSGEYIVKPRNGRTCECTLSGEVNGEIKTLGSSSFRVKSVPLPVAKFAGVMGSGTARLGAVKAALGVIADMQGFGFDGAQFTITSFSLSTVHRGNITPPLKVNGNRINTKAKTFLNSLKSGSILYIDDINSKGPGGKKILGGIKIKIM